MWLMGKIAADPEIELRDRTSEPESTVGVLDLSPGQAPGPGQP